MVSSRKPSYPRIEILTRGLRAVRRDGEMGEGRTAAMPALTIRQDVSADELRRLARREPDRRAVMRLLAIALSRSTPGFQHAAA
jgi:hypothetical protein